MNLVFKTKLAAFLTVLAFAASPTIVNATPHLTISPSSSSVNNGSNFDVTIGVDTGTETASSVDVSGTFDSSKLEIVSINKPASNPVFVMDTLQSLSDNNTGKFSFSAYDTSSSVVEDKALSGNLATITFKAKANGTAAVSFTCTPGSTIDSNILKSTSVDLIDCSTNQSGSYTISASGGGSGTSSNSGSNSNSSTSSNTTAAQTTPVANTTQAQLPKTGSAGSTIGLIIFGAVSLFSAAFLRLL